MFKSNNNLDFEVADYHLDNDFMCFRVGTCEGLWASTDISYDILAIINNQPGNGHLIDVLQWFEQSCRRDKKAFGILKVWNRRFKKHLIDKHSFIDIGNDNIIKYFK
jgi:hypothetical protein